MVAEAAGVDGIATAVGGGREECLDQNLGGCYHFWVMEKKNLPL